MEAQIESHRRVVSAADLAALQRPFLEASTLPADCYRSQEAYQAEVERIFRKEWICVGRFEDIPHPGDYVAPTIVSEPVVVVRNGEGEIRAHLNVCRHRGCQIVEDRGTVKAFRCPYHGWMYGLDGELRGAPDFKETVGFDKKDFSLVPLRCEVWEGFILVNLDRDATPFRDRVSHVERWGFHHYGIAEQVTTHRWTYDLDCNWKTYVENYIEEYHVPWVHAETLQPLTPMKRHVEFPELPSDQQWDLVVAQSPGLSLSDSGDALFSVSERIQEISPEYLGLPIWMCYPGFGVIPMLDCALYYSILPLGPERMELKIGLTLPRDAAEAYAAGDEHARRAADEYARNVESFVAEDNAICVKQQRGLRSDLSATGRFCKHEGLAWKFDNWVARVAYQASVPNQNGSNGSAHA